MNLILEDMSVHCAQDPVTGNVKKKMEIYFFRNSYKVKKIHIVSNSWGGAERWPISY